jgi:hypothetical protein
MEQFQGIDGAIGIRPNEFCLMSTYSFVSHTPYRGHISLAQETHKFFLMCLLVADSASAATVSAALAAQQPAARDRLVAVLDVDWAEAEATVDGIVPPVLIDAGRWWLGVWVDGVEAWELPAQQRGVASYDTQRAALEGRQRHLASYLRRAALAGAAKLRWEKPPGLFYRLGPDGVQFGMVNYWVTLSNARLTRAFHALTTP